VKTVGIIGGIAPESTIAYYRQILARCRELHRGAAENPPIIVNSIDLHRMLSLAGAKKFEELVDYLAQELARLAAAKADFAVFASNTPHIVFDELARRAPVPLISIVECAASAAAARGVRKAALLGTRFTMEGGFYEKTFAARGMEVVTPDGKDLVYVHDKYMSELVSADFRQETREGMLHVVDRLIDAHGIDAVILGGTELPLLLRDAEYRGVPFLDTTAMHVEAIVERLN
jgi:aspartate racemase